LIGFQLNTAAGKRRINLVMIYAVLAIYAILSR
jgi:hypothetical protein